ncbi:hypothetical protein AB6A40_010159 [Gnathostoma spinigerum]|uniref:BACK domain-containing protein n=1 Tax=Gnathostoma spinigerum TaxID=75299 RepID=A0ABD6EU01_9BILA
MSTVKDTILVRTFKNDYIVNLDLFAKHSARIATLKEAKQLPNVLDLTKYDVLAGATLCEFLAKADKTDVRITVFALGDLIELAIVLQMSSLLKKIDELILASSERDPYFRLHALSILSGFPHLLNSNTGRTILDLAVRDFKQISQSKTFSRLPVAIVLKILNRCDLPVESEFDVAVAGLYWLTAKANRFHFTYRIMRCVRSAQLTAEQRDEIEQMAWKASKHSEPVGK